MEKLGAVREVDELGRIFIPLQLLRTMEIEEEDALEIYVEDEKIVLKKHQPEGRF